MVKKQLAFIGIYSLLLSFTGCKNDINFNNQGATTYVDDNSFFSIVLPSSFKVSQDSEKDYSVLEFSSHDRFQIAGMISSRKLSDKEKKYSQIKLLDMMFKSSLNKFNDEKSKLIDCGQSKELCKGYPAFAITTLDESGKYLVVQWGTIVENRNYCISILTKNSEGSEELTSAIKEIVESIKMTHLNQSK